MASHRAPSFLLAILVCFLGSTQAYNFIVGGKHGWVLNPSEGYDQWAERNRFQVNDSLIFKYKKGSDSVLVVDKDGYYNCNKLNPIQVLEDGDGDSTFKFDRWGPFFFISGEGDNCEKGQKLIIVVLTPMNVTDHKAPSPVDSPKAESPWSTTLESQPDVDAPTPAPSAASAFNGSFGFVAGLSMVSGFFFGLV